MAVVLATAHVLLPATAFAGIRVTDPAWASTERARKLRGLVPESMKHQLDRIAPVRDCIPIQIKVLQVKCDVRTEIFIGGIVPGSKGQTTFSPCNTPTKIPPNQERVSEIRAI